MAKLLTSMASIKQVMDYFEYNSSKEFNHDWKQCSEKDKMELKQMVGAVVKPK